MTWIISEWRSNTYEVDIDSVVVIEKKPLFLSEKRRTRRLAEIEDIEFEIPSFFHSLINLGNVRLKATTIKDDFSFALVYDPRKVAEEIKRRVEAYHYRVNLIRERQRNER